MWRDVERLSQMLTARLRPTRMPVSGRRPSCLAWASTDVSLTVKSIAWPSSKIPASCPTVAMTRFRSPNVAAGLRVLETERVAVAVGFEDVSMLGIPAEYGNGMTLPFAIGGNKQVHLEPTDAWPLRALAVGADDIAREVVAGLMLRLQANR